MSSFNGTIALKRAALARARRVRLHVKEGRNRDELYWSQNEWCPCAVQCKRAGGASDPCDHSFYAHEYEVPVALAYAERAFFKALTANQAASWPVKFCKALPVGADEKRLNNAWQKFALTMLRHRKYGMIKCAYTHDQENAILNIIRLYEAGDFENRSGWQEASDAAKTAAYADTPYNMPRSANHKAQAGKKAASVAAALAAAVVDQRHIAEAVFEAPGALRDLWFGDLMASHEKAGNTYPTDEDTKSASQWQENACAWYSRLLIKNLHGGAVAHFFKLLPTLLP